jgi:hypothetical protein
MKRSNTMIPWLQEPETYIAHISCSARNVGTPGRLINRRPLKPTLFSAQDGVGILSESTYPNYGKFSEQLLMWVYSQQWIKQQVQQWYSVKTDYSTNG